MKFLTFGPFELKEISGDAIDKLFVEVNAAREGLAGYWRLYLRKAQWQGQAYSALCRQN